MLVKTENETVAAYPYSVEQLKADYPNVSFPSNLTAEQLAAFEVFEVVHADSPAYDPLTQRIETSAAPLLINGVWTLTKTVVDLSQEQIDAKTNAQWASVRADRNKRLADCDWTQLPDAPLTNTETANWGSYRQALRDITTQSDPFNINWPVAP